MRLQNLSLASYWAEVETVDMDNKAQVNLAPGCLSQPNSSHTSTPSLYSTVRDFTFLKHAHLKTFTRLGNLHHPPPIFT